MGCVNGKKKSRTPVIIKSSSELVIHPSTFVQMNTLSFRQVYKLGRRLGSGAYGDVCCCTHRATGSQRAVKMFRKDRSLSESEKNHINNEIQVLKKLDHPNIIRLYEFFEDSDMFYIVMEHCGGGELFFQIIKDKTLTESEVAAVVKQLLSCIAYIHSKGVMHRDLKPENILIESSEQKTEIKLIDFGAAKAFRSNQKVKGALGTAYYVAPEVVTGSYTEKCDVWSVGVVLYVLLCGSPPFTGRTDKEIINNIKKGNYNFEKKTWDDVSEQAKDLVKCLLVKEKLRPSAREALNHSWFSLIEKENSDENSYETAFSNLRSYSSNNKLREAVKTFIASQLLTRLELKEVKKVFLELDQNGDGKLSKEELVMGYSKAFGEEEAKEQVERIMSHVDTDKNGYLEYTEFLKAATDQEVLINEKNLKLAFEAFDKDSNGRISAKELKQVLCAGNHAEDFVWEEIIDQVDQNGDKEIDLKEFEDLILTKV